MTDAESDEARKAIDVLANEVRRLRGAVSAHEEVQRITGGLASHVELKMLREQLPVLRAAERLANAAVTRMDLDAETDACADCAAAPIDEIVCAKHGKQIDATSAEMEAATEAYRAIKGVRQP